MKNYITNTFAATGLIIFIFGMDCAAQSVSRITADIPFDFYVGKELLPKGRYEFEPASRHSYPTSLIVRPSAKTAQRSMIVPTMAADAAGRTSEGFSVIFNRYGSVHYLSRISGDPGSSLSLRLLRTSVEKHLAKQIERADSIAIRPVDTSGN